MTILSLDNGLGRRRNGRTFVAAHIPGSSCNLAGTLWAKDLPLDTTFYLDKAL